MMSDDDEPSALYPFSSFDLVVELTNEEIGLFHTIDRKLFYRLVRRLGKNFDESMNMVAFLIWLERGKYTQNAVRKVVDWPLDMVNQLCIEVFLCLRRLGNSEMWYREQYNDMYLLRKLCVVEINMTHLHEIRLKVESGVEKIVKEVCKKAFEDIMAGKVCRDLDVDGVEELMRTNVVQNPHFVQNPNIVRPPPPPRPFYPANYYNGERRMFVPHPTPPPPPPLYYNLEMGPRGFPQPGFGGNLGFPNLRTQQILVDPGVDLSELFGGMRLVKEFEDEPHVPPDQRTVFLTFSKGYYIPECEIRDFFTGLFGDFIEALYMQEVSKDEQPLYARMVCRSSSIIPMIAPPGCKEKYSINGKHIWAKKYVKKSNHRSSSGGAGTSS